MLFATGKVTRRLFRDGDPYDLARERAKVVPMREEIPSEYRYLLDWYSSEFAERKSRDGKDDPLLTLRGSGKDLWAHEHADEYVRRLREGWE